MWSCSNCGELSENHFDYCWNCQAEKGDAVTLPETKAAEWECDACGAEVEAYDSVCPQCGADISEVAGPQIFCSECGARVDDDAEFCSECAAPVAGSDLLNC